VFPRVVADSSGGTGANPHVRNTVWPAKLNSQGSANDVRPYPFAVHAAADTVTPLAVRLRFTVNGHRCGIDAASRPWRGFKFAGGGNVFAEKRLYYYTFSRPQPPHRTPVSCGQDLRLFLFPSYSSTITAAANYTVPFVS